MRADAAAHTLDVDVAAVANAPVDHASAAELSALTQATATFNSATAGADAAQAAFYQQIGLSGATYRVSSAQASRGMSYVLRRLGDLGVSTRLLRGFAAGVLVPHAEFVSQPGSAQAGTSGTSTSPTPSPGGAASASITSVTFSGGPRDPTIRVRGKNFGTLPPASPSGHPSGLGGCPSIAGDDGYDYGTNLYIDVPSAHWSGGRFRPDVGETDCIDLVVTTFTANEVRFHLGRFYTNLYPKFSLSAGTPVLVTVNGATYSATVAYG
jgi:hypothetical protein